MPEPVKVNVVSYGGVKPGNVVVGNTKDGEKTTIFDAATATDGTSMFYGRTNLTSWDVDLPNLTDANNMFSNCSNLRSFRGALPALKKANAMFAYVQNCDLRTVAFPAVQDAGGMFKDSSCLLDDTETFATVTNASVMFFRSSTLPPSAITLENATNVTQVFDNMNIVVRNLPNLNLSKITQAPGNFARGTAFNAATIRAIASTLPDRSSATAWYIAIGVDATLQDDAAVQADLQLIRDKNYNLTLQYNA